MPDPALGGHPVMQRPSKQELLARIDHALRASGRMGLRNVRVVAERDRISLRGQVPSYYLKQVAQTMALTIEGVESVQNDLVVC